jgi:dUTP pyrophosphatase
MKIKYKKLNDDATTPIQATSGDAGNDLFSTEAVELEPLQRKIVKTGISIAIPQGLYGRVAPRSGLAVKHGIDVLAGVIDAGYRGEVGVVLINLSSDKVSLEKGSKIAQLIIEKCHSVHWEEASDLSESERLDAGFGSTGV